MESRAEFTQGVADTLAVALKLQIPDKESHQLMPGVLAKLLYRQQHSKRDFASFDFVEMLSQVIGRVMVQELPNLLKLADVLQDGGHTSPDDEYDFGYADKYACVLLNEEKRKAMAFRTQNINYVMFLRNHWHGWELHLRRFYSEVDDDELQEMLEFFEPTREGIMYLADRRTEYFSDDVEGNTFPHRLSLNSFIRTDFAADCDKACRGLRYLDCRDTGYLASADNRWFDEPGCDKIGSTDLGLLQYVWNDVISNVDVLVLHPED